MNFPFLIFLLSIFIPFVIMVKESHRSLKLGCLIKVFFADYICHN